MKLKKNGENYYRVILFPWLEVSTNRLTTGVSKVIFFV